jgi:hypothetical protein
VLIKLDENLGRRGAAQLRAAGHDTTTVFDQGLTSASDVELIRVCLTEGRVLVTLDTDFADPVRFKPADYAGIAVLRLPRRPQRSDLLEAIRTLIGGLEMHDLTGKLWIVDRGFIREHQPASE